MPRITVMGLKLIFAVIASVAIAMTWFYFSIVRFADEPLQLPEQKTLYMVEPGQGLIKVAQSLQKQNVIENARDFIWFARFEGSAEKIKVGEYEITSEMTPRMLLRDLVEGKVKQYSLTIVEGWTFKQVLVALSTNDKIRKTLTDVTSQQLAEKIGVAGENPEGWLLPDTYFFPAKTSDVEFLKRAHSAMKILLEREWQTRDQDLPYESAYEALTMASIVEKETGVASERGEIAGVFTRRLQARMRLQTDPTVIYGMGEDYAGNIKREDLKRDTPYNTYTRRGLPPTPIALPSADAIKAAMHPTPGDALYFVAKGDGSHHFSSSIEEHNKAVRTYQIKRRKKDYRSAPVNES